MRLLLFVFLAAVLAGCAKASGPLKLYLIGSTRLTAGNRTFTYSDTSTANLAARLYADDASSSPVGITHLLVTVDYAPRRLPFVYPTPLSSFLIGSVTPNSEQLVYLDSTFTTPPTELLYTALFGARTTVGTERWTFEVGDRAGNTSARSFVIQQRRSDSTTIYNEFTLKLSLPVTGTATRRFIDLKSGLALPGYTVARAGARALQDSTDIILTRDGALTSPDSPTLTFSSAIWPDKRRKTSFALTSLTATTFETITDTARLRSVFTGTSLSSIGIPTAGQVYAVRAQGVPGRYSHYGLMLVVNTASGYQLRVRMAKRPL